MQLDDKPPGEHEHPDSEYDGYRYPKQKKGDFRKDTRKHEQHDPSKDDKDEPHDDLPFPRGIPSSTKDYGRALKSFGVCNRFLKDCNRPLAGRLVGDDPDRVVVHLHPVGVTRQKDIGVLQNSEEVRRGCCIEGLDALDRDSGLQARDREELMYGRHRPDFSLAFATLAGNTHQFRFRAFGP